ncbi:hypothetical protein EJ04DRAFT_34935 [Polyplosphaeria fusca]|uniref:Uncharacterized protein n=1 Tax=Polyplosphaeria fusca TaxID=682080 RepID=A0A9P4QNF6_9PLEO|nr:hypothetical protein EJ04DRAFT_34935 [Polyplosphaeria fusca]
MYKWKVRTRCEQHRSLLSQSTTQPLSIIRHDSTGPIPPIILTRSPTLSSPHIPQHETISPQQCSSSPSSSFPQPSPPPSSPSHFTPATQHPASIPLFSTVRATQPPPPLPSPPSTRPALPRPASPAPRKPPSKAPCPATRRRSRSALSAAAYGDGVCRRVWTCLRRLSMRRANSSGGVQMRRGRFSVSVCLVLTLGVRCADSCVCFTVGYTRSSCDATYVSFNLGG